MNKALSQRSGEVTIHKGGRRKEFGLFRWLRYAYLYLVRDDMQAAAPNPVSWREKVHYCHLRITNVLYNK